MVSDPIKLPHTDEPAWVCKPCVAYENRRRTWRAAFVRWLAKWLGVLDLNEPTYRLHESLFPHGQSTPQDFK